MPVRLGIDTGGTFTDLVALDEDSGAIAVVKRSSTPDDPSRAILLALRHADVDSAAIARLVLGTTVAINSLLQRQGARVIYIASEGFEDIPFLQRINRRFHYDLKWVRPLPLVRRRDCLGVPERMDYRGNIDRPLEESHLQDLATAIRARLDDAIEGDVAIAVNLLFAYVNPTHERRLRDFLLAEFPDLPVSISSDVAPIWREYERSSTTLADAYVRPHVGSFIGSLQEGLENLGFMRSWAVMKSNGGQMLSAVAQDRPVQMILSGLSAGIIAGRFYGALTGSDNVITLDIGGTSTDVGVVVEGRVRFTTEWRIEFGLPVSAPLIDLSTLGAGGGSIAWINKGGILQVGPHSAGAAPGPACYGQGGVEPTVTDANVVLGRLNPDNFLGGEMRLD
ncbi:MAG TPA: hydantoinase/oxoprolinase family protein, partial [Chloroflexota bacterium]|nr:hydantoinase/oxoprolinase family protein [Chloroflexota bacterium]